MDTAKLLAIGLNEHQAQAYALLIEKGELSPADAATQLGLSRTNAYKVLDKLVETGIALKKEVRKKVVYAPDNPLAISNLVSEQRNLATSREEAANAVMSELLAMYHTHTDQPHAQVVTGRSDVANAYRAQIQQQQTVYFIRSRADIPVMGFNAMEAIRTTPSRYGLKRCGITPDMGTGTTANPDTDQRSDLSRTWVRQEDYTAPVEWSVCGSSLLIVIFEDEPHAITIESPIVAEAFKQIWLLLNSTLKAMPYYSQLPRK